MNIHIEILIFLTVNIIVRVDSLECYETNMSMGKRKGIEDEYKCTSRQKSYRTTVCKAADGEVLFWRECATDCKEITYTSETTQRCSVYCCSSDLCNGAICKTPFELFIVIIMPFVNYILN